MSSAKERDSGDERASTGKEGRDQGPRQRIPYRLFGRKFMKTGKFVVSSRIWLHTIPTRNCDILMTFHPNTEDSTLMWLLAQLKARTPQVIVHVRHHVNTEVFGFYMTASYENLLKGAEDLAIRKPMKEEYGGGKKEFTFEDQDFFEGVGDEAGFLTSQERQSIVYNMLNNLRALEGEQLGKIKFLEGQAIVPLLQSKNVISQVFPLHNSDDLNELRKYWVNAPFQNQPLGKICEYFGVKIAMYFTYLGHYTAALCIPAIFGFFLWSIQSYSKMLDDFCFVTFALFNVFWATLYLEHWKRRSAELAYRWGTLDKKDELIEDPRPLYTGDLFKSPVTGRLEPFYPNWKSNVFHYFVTLPVICVCLAVVFVVMLLNFQFQEWIHSLVKSGDCPVVCKIIPKILYACSIFVLDRIYTIIAIWLNDMENYRMQQAYENNLIIKLVLFQFVNSFLSLFYIAFYLQDMDQLREQLMALLIVRQLIGNFKEAIWPYLLWHFRLFKVGLVADMESPEKEAAVVISNKDNENSGRSPVPPAQTHAVEGEDNFIRQEYEMSLKSSHTSPSQAEVESTMSKYEDTYEDYLEMFIQFGYVILFSSAFPLAAVCALLNNLIEIRSDAFKLCITCQRPFGQRVENIGIWEDALMFMGIAAVIVNCALIGVFGHVQRFVPWLDSGSTLLLIIILEHLILILKLWIAYAIPDIPQWVALEMARLEFLRREALKKLESQTQSSLNQSPYSPLDKSSVGCTVSKASTSVTSPLTVTHPLQKSSPQKATERELTQPVNDHGIDSDQICSLPASSKSENRFSTASVSSSMRTQHDISNVSPYRAKSEPSQPATFQQSNSLVHLESTQLRHRITNNGSHKSDPNVLTIYHRFPSHKKSLSKDGPSKSTEI